MGILLWIIVGSGVATLSWLLTPRGGLRPHWRRLLALGVTGAVVGGMLATAFGFGGFLALDPRAAISAALGALAAILVGSLLLASADSVP